eukprot:gene26980-2533_t
MAALEDPVLARAFRPPTREASPARVFWADGRKSRRGSQPSTPHADQPSSALTKRRSATTPVSPPRRTSFMIGAHELAQRLSGCSSQESAGKFLYRYIAFGGVLRPLCLLHAALLLCSVLMSWPSACLGVALKSRQRHTSFMLGAHKLAQGLSGCSSQESAADARGELLEQCSTADLGQPGLTRDEWLHPAVQSPGQFRVSELQMRLNAGDGVLPDMTFEGDENGLRSWPSFSTEGFQISPPDSPPPEPHRLLKAAWGTDTANTGAELSSTANTGAELSSTANTGAELSTTANTGAELSSSTPTWLENSQSVWQAPESPKTGDQVGRSTGLVERLLRTPGYRTGGSKFECKHRAEFGLKTHAKAAHPPERENRT